MNYYATDKDLLYKVTKAVVIPTRLSAMLCIKPVLAKISEPPPQKKKKKKKKTSGRTLWREKTAESRFLLSCMFYGWEILSSLETKQTYEVLTSSISELLVVLELHQNLWCVSTLTNF